MNALAVIEADAAAANTARRNDPYTSPATIKACAKESAAARAAIAELIEAARAVNVAITCGQHEDRINRSNPLSVEALRAALARVGGGK